MTAGGCDDLGSHSLQGRESSILCTSSFCRHSRSGLGRGEREGGGEEGERGREREEGERDKGSEEGGDREKE